MKEYTYYIDKQHPNPVTPDMMFKIYRTLDGKVFQDAWSQYIGNGKPHTWWLADITPTPAFKNSLRELSKRELFALYL